MSDCNLVKNATLLIQCHTIDCDDLSGFFQLMFIILHVEKGTPFETTDQGKYRDKTVWEQLDKGTHFSASKKFLTVVPIVL